MVLKKGDTGCPICDCNPDPVCQTLSSLVKTECPLDCEKGLITNTGCTECKCNPVEPCKCGPQPTDRPVLCPDGVTFQKNTGICNDKCEWVLSRCPIGISVTLSKPLTEDEIMAIKAKIGITNADDVTFTKVDNNDGTVTYTMWVKKEGIPAGKSADDVNNDVSSESKKSDPNAASYVLSDGTPMTSFGFVLAPLFGLLSIVFYLI